MAHITLGCMTSTDHDTEPQIPILNMYVLVTPALFLPSLIGFPQPRITGLLSADSPEWVAELLSTATKDLSTGLASVTPQVRELKSGVVTIHASSPGLAACSWFVAGGGGG
jgi:hypothetical protein